MMRRARVSRGFFFALALLLKAGLPLHEALTCLERTERNSTSQKMIQRIKTDIGSGGMLSFAIQKYAPLVPPLAIHFIALGEQTGTLARNLDLTANHLQGLERSQQKTVSALIYPCFTAIISFCGIFLLAKIFLPNFIPLFNDFRGSLPLPTKILLWFVKMISSYTAWVGLFSLSALVLLALKKYRNRLDRLAVSIPFFGKLMKLTYAAELSRTLAASHAAGISMDKALGFYGQSLINTVFRSATMEMRLALIHGDSLAISFSKQRKLMPSYVSAMTSIAEKTGKMNDLLSRCAQMAEDEITDRLQRFTTALEPMVLGFLGVFVGLILTGVLSPLYKMVETLS